MDLDLSGRLRFVVMITFSGILNFIFYLTVINIVGFFSLSRVLGSTLLDILHLGVSVFAVYLGIILTNYFIPNTPKVQKTNSLALEKPSVRTHKLSQGLFDGFTFENFLSQLKVAIILISCIYLPLDLISYLLPGVLEFTATSLDAYALDNYFLLDPLISMIFFTAIIHFTVAAREEFIYREFFLTLGEEHVKKGTAFLYSAILFGIAHVNYIFSPQSVGISPLYPIWWGINALIIGFVSAYQFSKSKQIIPLILVHWINNLLSAIVVRNHIRNIPFWSQTFLYLYLPFFVIGIFMIVLSRKSIKTELTQFIALFKAYKSENPDKRYYAVDLLILVFLWLITFLL